MSTRKERREERKALAVIGKRPRGCDCVADVINNRTVVFVLGDVDADVVHGLPPLR